MKDLTGKTFGHLYVRQIGRSTQRGFTWHCECDCGRHVELEGRVLRRGQVVCSKRCPLRDFRPDLTAGKEAAKRQKVIDRALSQYERDSEPRSLTRRIPVNKIIRRVDFEQVVLRSVANKQDVAEAILASQ